MTPVHGQLIYQGKAKRIFQTAQDDCVLVEFKNEGLFNCTENKYGSLFVIFKPIKDALWEESKKDNMDFRLAEIMATISFFYNALVRV